MQKVEEESGRLHMAVPMSWLRKIDAWRRRQPDLPNRSEAVRRLVDAGMNHKARERKRRRA